MSDDIGQLERDIRRRIEKAEGGPRISRENVGELLLHLSDEYRDPEADDE
jgi:hypothetical protein